MYTVLKCLKIIYKALPSKKDAKLYSSQRVKKGNYIKMDPVEVRQPTTNLWLIASV